MQAIGPADQSQESHAGHRACEPDAQILGTIAPAVASRVANSADKSRLQDQGIKTSFPIVFPDSISA